MSTASPTIPPTAPAAAAPAPTTPHAAALAALRAGRVDEASAIAERLVQADPADAGAWMLAGLTRTRTQPPDAALAAFETCVRLDPGRGEAWTNYGVTLLGAGRTEDAIAAQQRAAALRPRVAEVHANLGKALRAAGRLDEAVAALETALRLRPDLAEAALALGATHHLANRQEAALAAFETAIRIRPGYAEALTNKGNVLKALDRTEEAMEAYSEAARCRPDLPESHGNLAILLHALGRYEEALEAVDRALALRPGESGPLAIRIKVLTALGRFEDALADAERAIARDPEIAVLHLRRGIALAGVGRTAEAVAAFELASTFGPDRAEARLNRGILRFLAGDLTGGYEDYEQRWNVGEAVKTAARYTRPLWSGEDIAGRTILVYGEQGYGDMLQFLRYAPMVAARGARVLLDLPDRLHRLARSIQGPGIELVDRAARKPLRHDLRCPLLSLPRAFATTVETIPGRVPYIAAEPELAAEWRERIGPDGFKIGVAWQGNPKNGTDRSRSFPLAALAPLARVPGVRLISLQRDYGLDQLASLPPGMEVERLDPDLDDGPDAFVDTAAAMMALDLVVACDSAVGHLAGALARPTWLGLAALPDWRWMLDRADSPWYPTMRLYRQGRSRVWSEVFERMAEDLAERVRMPGMPSVPVSWGEVIDKITILRLKRARIADPAARANVARELELLEAVLAGAGPLGPEGDRLVAALAEVNERLWEIEDAIRAREAAGDFGTDFVALARSVYRTNDERSALKRRLNLLMGSAIVEEKHYTGYAP